MWTTPPLEILSTRNVSAKQGVKIMGYARSGIGKTYLIKTAPKPFALSSERGLLSLQKENIPYVNIRLISDLDKMLTWLYQRGDDERIQTVCLDSITDIADTVVENELTLQKDPRKAYGILYSEVMKRYKWFRDLPYRHVYFIAQQESVKDEVTGAVMWGPSFPGQKLTVKSPYLFDETFQLIVDKNQQRWLRTRPDFQNEAKDRSGVLDEFEPANLTTVINKIMAAA